MVVERFPATRAFAHKVYRYLNKEVVPEESEEESPAGRLTPTPRTPQRQMNGESIEMLAKGVLA